MRKIAAGFSRAMLCALAGALILCGSAFAQAPINPPITTQRLDVTSGNLQPVSSISSNVVGTRGNSTFYYWVVAEFTAGQAPVSSYAQVLNAPNALSVTNYVAVSWSPVPGATSYDLLRTTSPNLPNTPASIAVHTAIAGTTYSDQGAALGSYTLNPAKGSKLSVTPFCLIFPDLSQQCTASSGGGAPGGAANSVQYNNAGAFGGFGSWDGSTFTIPNASGQGLTFGADNASITGHSGGALNFNLGALGLTAGGTNQNITLTPSGSGVLVSSGGYTMSASGSVGFVVGPREIFNSGSNILIRSSGGVFVQDNSGGNGGTLRVSGYLAGTINTVSFSATPVFSLSGGNIQKITLTGNVTSSTTSGGVAAEPLTFLICQDSAGSHTFVWPANVLGGMTIGSTASKCSAQSFIYDGTNLYAVSSGVTNM